VTLSSTDALPPDLSVVVPVYNEERRLAAVLRSITGLLAGAPERAEVLVVDDGSADGTASIAQAFAGEFAGVRLIRLDHAGKAHAVLTGLTHARAPLLLHMDADLSSSPQECMKLVEALRAGYDIAIGSRPGRPGAPLTRRLMSVVWRLAVRSVLTGFADTQCGFKAYKSSAIGPVFSRLRLSAAPGRPLRRAKVSAAADVEMLFVAQRLGLRIAEVPLSWRHAGDSKVQPLADGVEGLWGLVQIRANSLRGRYR